MRRYSSSDEGRVSSLVGVTGQIRSTTTIATTNTNNSAGCGAGGGVNTFVPSTSSHPTSSSSKRCRIGVTTISPTTTHIHNNSKEMSSSKPPAPVLLNSKASALQVGGSATESPLSLRACCAEESVPTTPIHQPPALWLVPAPPPSLPSPQRTADATISLDSGTVVGNGGGAPSSSSISPVAQEAHSAILSYLHTLNIHSHNKPVIDDAIVEVARLEDRYEVCGKVGSGSHSIVYHVQRERRSRGSAQPHEDTTTVTKTPTPSSLGQTSTTMSSLRRRKLSYAAKVISLLSHTLEEVLLEVNISLKLQFNSSTDRRHTTTLCIPKIYKVIIAPDGTHIAIVMELLKGGELFREVSALSPSNSTEDAVVGGGMSTTTTPIRSSQHPIPIPRPSTTIVAQDRASPQAATGPTPSTSYTVNTTGAGGGRVGQTTPPPSTSYLPSVHSSGGGGGSGSGLFLRSTSSSMSGASSTGGYDDAPLPTSKLYNINNNNHGHHVGSTPVPPPTPPQQQPLVVISQREMLVRHYLWDVLNALSTFHEAGIAHRDIKLENIVQIATTQPSSQSQQPHLSGALNSSPTQNGVHHQPLVKIIDMGFARDITTTKGGVGMNHSIESSVPPSPMISYTMTPPPPARNSRILSPYSREPPAPIPSFEMLPPITPPRQNSNTNFINSTLISPNERASSFTHSQTGEMIMMRSRSPTPLLLGGGDTGGNHGPISISPSLSPSPSRTDLPRARPDRPFTELVGSSQYVAPEALRASRFKSNSASNTPQRGMSPQTKPSPSPHGGGTIFSSPTPLPGAFSRQAASGGYGREVDVWAAGVCLYTLLFGKYPFNAQRSSHQHRNIMSGKYTTPTYLANMSKSQQQHHLSSSHGDAVPSSECLHLLRQMLTVDPDVRITATEALSHPWFALMSGQDKAPL